VFSIRCWSAAGLPYPTTDWRLLSAIGIAGIDRLVQKNVLAMSGRAVEAAGDVDVSCWTRRATSRWEIRPQGPLHPSGFFPAALESG